MAMKKCMQCGRQVPPDEEQLVRDQMVVGLEPLSSLVSVPAQTFLDSLFDDSTTYCAQCFRKMDDDFPLHRWSEQLAEDPLQHPAMFRWHLIKKGANHVDE